MSAVRPIVFPGPAGELEGLWKEAEGTPAGAAVFAHPHPLHGGTLHNKVVYRAARALTAAGFSTLRFNFRGVGGSSGRHDEGRGEVEDFRAAMDEAERRGGPPLVAGGFSFGAAIALSAVANDPRVIAYVGAGLPVGSGPAPSLPRPRVPALFVVGERDSFGPPERLRVFVGESGKIVVIPGADHFFEGKLELLGATISDFLATLAAAPASPR